MRYEFLYSRIHMGVTPLSGAGPVRLIVRPGGVTTELAFCHHTIQFWPARPPVNTLEGRGVSNPALHWPSYRAVLPHLRT